MKNVLVSTIAASAFLVSGAAFASVEIGAEGLNATTKNVGGSFVAESLSTTFDADTKNADSIENFGWNELESN